MILFRIDKDQQQDNKEPKFQIKEILNRLFFYETMRGNFS